MKVAIWSELDDVETALARLGLAVAPLLVAVSRGHLAAISRTSNDAPNAAGFYQWNETLRTLREELALFEFIRSDIGGYSTALRGDRRMAIAVSSGDEGTGVAAANPSTKQVKGPRTIAAVSSNATQLELFPREIMMPPPAEEIDRLTWILLFRAAATELRAELSLPVNMNDGGQIAAWRERIILPSLPLDDATFTIPEPDFGPDLDIEIQRRT